jgi:putative tryptophan/tyrosine transport system substrate-binding protein
MLDMKRREFIALVGGGGLLLAVKVKRAWGQQSRQVRRIGILMPYPSSDAESQSYVRAFRQELARLGWSEGGNVQFDERWSTSNLDLVRADAANLVICNPRPTSGRRTGRCRRSIFHCSARTNHRAH